MLRVSYHVYRWWWLLRNRVRRRVTNAGLLIGFAAAVTAMLGVDTEQSFAYQAFAFLFSLLLIALAFLPFFRGHFEFERQLPRFASVGQRLRYKVTVRNKTSSLQKGLVLLEELLNPFLTFDEFCLQVGRHRSFRRAESPVLRPRARFLEAALPSLLPGQDQEASIEVVPLRRGRLRFKGIRLARPDPFGLIRSFIRLPGVQSLVVLPKRYQLPPLAWPGLVKYQLGGVALASSVGESEEYVFLRDYRRGDPLRHMHWKSWAKLGRPIVKAFQDEFFVRHALILDTFGGLDHPEVFEEAVSVAASFAYTIQNQDSLLDLMFVGTQAFCFTAGRGLAQTDQVLEVLAEVARCRDQSFQALETLVLEHAAGLSGCVCVLQDWDEPRQHLAEQLNALGLPLLILVIVPPGRTLTPGRAVGASGRFHVLETGRIAEGLARLGADPYGA